MSRNAPIGWVKNNGKNKMKIYSIFFISGEKCARIETETAGGVPRRLLIAFRITAGQK